MGLRGSREKVTSPRLEVIWKQEKGKGEEGEEKETN